MFTPFTSRHFTVQKDPVSGTPIALLTTRVAPIQQGFYFVNSCFSDDGRYMWFYCAFPPADGHSLGVVDFLTDEVHHFPETAASDATWLVDPRTGNVYWGCRQGLFMRTPDPADKAVRIAPLPEVCRKAGVKTCVGTHLTFTPDFSEILIDISTMLGAFVGTYHLETGEFTLWYRTDGLPYNHAQMCPTDPDLCMCAHEYSFDPKLGGNRAPEYVDGIYPRMQLISRDGKRRMLKPIGNYATHEWWAPSGKSVYYCNSSLIENGGRVSVVAQDHLDGSDPEVVCRVRIPGGCGTWHAHCSKDEQYFVMDGSYPHGELTWWRGCESMVHFYNRKTGKLFKFLTRNPVAEGWTPQNPSNYHIDPHPRFVLHDRYVCFTATIRGHVDVALTPVVSLLEATE